MTRFEKYLMLLMLGCSAYVLPVFCDLTDQSAKFGWFLIIMVLALTFIAPTKEA